MLNENQERPMNQPISMICWHSESGNVKPYRFKMKDDEGEDVVLTVSKVIWQKEERIVGVNYLCYNLMCLVNKEFIRNFEIRYNKNSCIWKLVKIV